MPHIMVHPRVRRAPVFDFRVTVRTPEGRSTFTVPATCRTEAEKEAIRLYAEEHDTPIAAVTVN